jgi:bifunctional DNA-binding transcriptional regulator/antitoxin component of YhaV-PrlF toxin-antitoxin module
MVSTTVEIDANGMIELPEEMLKVLNWGVDDVIEWVDKGDGSFLLHKVNE